MTYDKRAERPQAWWSDLESSKEIQRLMMQKMQSNISNANMTDAAESDYDFE